MLNKYDPRAILISAFILILSISFLSNYFMLAGIIIICAFMLTKAAFKHLFAANVFTIFIWLTFPFTVDNGVALALLYTLRINACILIIMLSIAPMGISVLSNTLIALHCPGKLVALLLLTYRSICLLKDKLFTALTAMKLRKPASISTIRSWRSYAALFATVIAAAIHRSERMQQAMMLRGFDGTMPATAVLQWKLADTALIAFVVFIVAVLCYGQLCWL